MKSVLMLFLFSLVYLQQIESQPIISEKGHPEHVIAGTIIGGTISYFVYKKTNNKFKAWLIGAASTAALAYLKEVVDPLWLNGTRSNADFAYTALGGLVGASIIIPLDNRRKRSRKRPCF